ncbi:WXG100 family type VII secretion target [Kitasatospora sp. NPDC058965]|uniref:WXG100 family type VII secretion target n=1 Tax=Kitasatospora sp. NPDC058965 TaxID=3346682 RepID=UPI0036BF686D
MPGNDATSILVHAQLGEVGPHIHASAEEIIGELQRLVQLLEPLRDTWTTSEAAADYEIMQQEWNTAAEGLFGPNGVLGNVAAVMNVNFVNYSDAEWANVSTWRHR